MGADALDVVLEGLLIEEFALLGLHRRITNHACGASDKGDRLVAALLEVLQNHYANEVADVQGISCRIDPDISGLRAFHEFLLSPGHDVLDHAPPLKFLYEILHLLMLCFLFVL